MAQRHFELEAILASPSGTGVAQMAIHADFLRLKAEECRTMAHLLHEDDARSQLLTIAEQYECLAERCESIEKTLMWAPLPPI